MGNRKGSSEFETLFVSDKTSLFRKVYFSSVRTGEVYRIVSNVNFEYLHHHYYYYIIFFRKILLMYKYGSFRIYISTNGPSEFMRQIVDKKLRDYSHAERAEKDERVRPVAGRLAGGGGARGRKSQWGMAGRGGKVPRGAFVSTAAVPR